MRKLLFTIAFLTSIAQAQYVVSYRQYTDALGVTNNYSICMPTDSALYKHPIVIQLPGSGESLPGGANTQANANKWGVTRTGASGWNGVVTQGDSTTKFILVCCQRGVGSSGYNQNWIMIKRILDQLAPYIDFDQLHLTGISLGGDIALFIGSNLSDTNYQNFTTTYLASAGDRTSGINAQLPNLKYYAGKGGRIMTTSGSADPNFIYTLPYFGSYMNDTVPGSAIGYIWNAGENGYTNAGHTNWDISYSATQTFPYFGNKTYFEYIAQFTKAPRAKAANPATTTGTAVTLNGVTNGWYKSVAWTKISGPAGGTIVNSNKDTTAVTGLTEGNYVYRLTTTNQHTAVTATWDVSFSVQMQTTTMKRKKYQKLKFK